MPTHPKPEQDQLDLKDPKAKSHVDYVLNARTAINTLVNYVAICCVHKIKDKGGTFTDAKKMGRDAFAAYIIEFQNRANEKWPDFFVNYVKNQNLGVSDESLEKLKEKMEVFSQRQKLSELIDVRKQCRTLLSNKKNGLPKESIEKIQELLYDLSFPHFQ